MDDIKNLAETVKTQLSLKYNAESVKYLEGFIERVKIEMTEEELKGLINSCSAFLGECIIKNFGGQWVNHDDEMAIAFDDENKIFPLTKVEKQFKNGLEDSIYSFYNAIQKVFDIKKKKKWWQFD
nr:hypothetical protein [uncultured Flavobacterium sp.]